MLIWGTKNVTRNIGTGEFYCPSCRSRQAFRQMRVQRHGHVYWIPLFATGKAVDYVECLVCGGTYDPAVLEHQPRDDRTFRAEMSAAVIATLVAVAKADGQVSDSELDVIQDVALRVSGAEVDRSEIRRISAVPGAGDLNVALRMIERVAPGLSAEGKELVIKAALVTAMSDGNVARA